MVSARHLEGSPAKNGGPVRASRRRRGIFAAAVVSLTVVCRAKRAADELAADAQCARTARAEKRDIRCSLRGASAGRPTVVRAAARCSAGCGAVARGRLAERPAARHHLNCWVCKAGADGGRWCRIWQRCRSAGDDRLASELVELRLIGDAGLVVIDDFGCPLLAIGLGFVRTLVRSNTRPSSAISSGASTSPAKWHRKHPVGEIDRLVQVMGDHDHVASRPPRRSAGLRQVAADLVQTLLQGELVDHVRPSSLRMGLRENRASHARTRWPRSASH